MIYRWNQRQMVWLIWSRAFTYRGKKNSERNKVFASYKKNSSFTPSWKSKETGSKANGWQGRDKSYIKQMWRTVWTRGAVGISSPADKARGKTGRVTFIYTVKQFCSSLGRRFNATAGGTAMSTSRGRMPPRSHRCKIGLLSVQEVWTILGY